MSTVLTHLLPGAALGFSLIAAIGAQNSFVLRQGVRGQHLGLVLAICIASVWLLIGAGVAGAGALISRHEGLMTWIRFVGAAFLLLLGLAAARRALRPGTLQTGSAAAPRSPGSTALSCLGGTWLNPHVYLDTVVLLGAVAAAHGSGRWWFGGAAAISSLLWFLALGLGATLLRPVLARPAAWRLLDGIIAIMMTALALTLVISL